MARHSLDAAAVQNVPPPPRCRTAEHGPLRDSLLHYCCSWGSSPPSFFSQTWEDVTNVATMNTCRTSFYRGQTSSSRNRAILREEALVLLGA
jgi:hypothetical protein